LTRTIIAIATALGAVTIFASAAQACISCEYVPEVLKAGEQGSASRNTVRSHEDSAPTKRATRREAVKSRVRDTDDDDVKTTRAKASEPETSTAKAEPAKTPATNAETENSSMAGASTGAAPVPVKQAAEDNGSKSENSTIANNDPKPEIGTDIQAKIEPAVSRQTVCSRYFPTAGRTLQVPCE
jgi:hypothetical protein